VERRHRAYFNNADRHYYVNYLTPNYAQFQNSYTSGALLSGVTLNDLNYSQHGDYAPKQSALFTEINYAIDPSGRRPPVCDGTTWNIRDPLRGRLEQWRAHPVAGAAKIPDSIRKPSYLPGDERSFTTPAHRRACAREA